MTAIAIEAGIPLPNKYPFNLMEVGDSFLLPGNVTRTTVSVAAARFGRMNDVLFTIRKTKDGFRRWRIE